MCGIIGYTGKAQAGPIILEGLKNLEYRGYDSSGIAVMTGGTIRIKKCPGKISNLSKKTRGGTTLHGYIGIGHTRWATHGEPNEINAHPHRSADGRFAIVHNGIIENFSDIKASLISSGIEFHSETDSEVIAQLLQKLYNGDMLSTLSRLIKQLIGSYAVCIICTDNPDTIYAIRKNNPLVVGYGDGENFVASDVTAALGHTHKFALLGDGEIAEVTARDIKFYSADKTPVTKKPYTVDWDIKQAEKCGYEKFMLKEIYEQPRAIVNTISARMIGEKIVLDKVKFSKHYLDKLNRIDIVGCGSAYHAGMVGKTFIEKHCRIPVNCMLASEYIYSNPITDSRTLTIIISQSGETADTLEALKMARSRLSRTLAIVNVVHSAIAREADDVLYTRAGPEIAVPTTKGYTTQIAALYLVGLNIALTKGSVTEERYRELLGAISALPAKIEAQLREEELAKIRELADIYFKHKCIFFIGRGTDYAASLEGALKLKEISYIHAEAYAAGELKHGTISLIGKHTLTLALVTQKSLYGKMESNIKSITSRKGTVIALASPENAGIAECAHHLLTIPDCDDDISPILTVVALQLFAYYVASNRKCDIDKPRNLAKSVTVE